jgi:quercetin 2,3-dioxygenase
MSGPIEEKDAHWINERQIGVDVRQGRSTTVGGMEISRILPTKGRRTIGAWCFVDLMIPPDADDPDPLEIGPHPHIGLHTVTWLFTGEALHSDSLGTEQVIRPGQLNLMTAGNGIAHAELSIPEGVQGAQMWIAQPEKTRHGEPAFEHHDELPRVEVGDGEATVIAGSFREATSPARTDTELVGLDMRLGAAAEIELRSDFEYGFVPLDSPVKVGEAIVEPGWLGLVEAGPDAVQVEPSSAGSRSPPDRGRAARREGRHVVELRRPQQGRDDRRLAGLAGPRHRPVRPGSLQAGPPRRSPPALAAPGVSDERERDGYEGLTLCCALQHRSAGTPVDCSLFNRRWTGSQPQRG